MGNFYNGANTGKAATSWGWFAKLVEANNVIATVNSTDTNSSNSIAIERNTKYNVQVVVVPTARVAHVFVNGTYIGKNVDFPTISKQGQNNLTLRFGDGPQCGQVFDNFVIADLK